MSLKEKWARLIKILKEMQGVVVAFSGGVDSTLLLKVASDVLGKNKVLAITAVSETYPKEELKSARKIAKLLGVRLRLVKTKEWQNKKFRSNPPNRCYYCKKELFTILKKIAPEENLNWSADGTTKSDEADFRPGSLAAKELGVRKPLLEAGLTKEEVRNLSRKFRLPTADKPAAACLASRIPYYTPLTEEKVRMVEKGEAFLRKQGITGNIRLRHHGALARIEVDAEAFPKLLAKREEISRYLKRIGFTFITLDLEGYRTGSLNEP
ncbi:MAG: TIGR00268 family protein [bacterium (Candidatus Ratteibacteria) CG23_combo_of_CG06-09_8_20_14_all_48_7]|uniref:TIGR00268 family protein n=1 Tax=bacterium (Candidatus Ratteibacteria) CG23_combo_of_CG06-09_8_20_14_all_48_7 TaxID=2014292 RepID=A0A2G9YE10_9BACT|nr:MAG: TIGR00268 family protein [bacterium (Candidatus Ratteibacteria) CG23_combo_of_CG06-09_8_20_14_all_48_7]